MDLQVYRLKSEEKAEYLGTIHSFKWEDTWRRAWARVPRCKRMPIYHAARRISAVLRWLADRLDFWTACTVGDLVIEYLRRIESEAKEAE